jgi:hypothetical protein
MILLPQVPFQALHTQHQDVHKQLHPLSEVQQAQALHIRQVHQAISHQHQHQAQTIHPQLVELATQLQDSRLEDQLVTSHQVHLKDIQARKDHTQVLELQSHHQMCHQLTNLHKVSHHKTMLLTQQLEHHKRRTENTFRHDEDKLMQTNSSHYFIHALKSFSPFIKLK